MKTIIKLLVAAAVLNAVVRAGAVALDYYQFEDAAQQAVLFGADSTVPELREQILQQAAEYGVPLKPEDLDVRRNGTLTVAEASYTEGIQFFPGFRYPLKFSFSVDARQYNTPAAGTAPTP